MSCEPTTEMRILEACRDYPKRRSWHDLLMEIRALPETKGKT